MFHCPCSAPQHLQQHLLLAFERICSGSRAATQVCIRNGVAEFALECCRQLRQDPSVNALKRFTFDQIRAQALSLLAQIALNGDVSHIDYLVTIGMIPVFITNMLDQSNNEGLVQTNVMDGLFSILEFTRTQNPKTFEAAHAQMKTLDLKKSLVHLLVVRVYIPSLFVGT